MKKEKFCPILLILTMVLFVSSVSVFAEGKKEEVKKEFPPPPPYDSAGFMPDEGVVKPVDIMPDEPLRFVFLTVETNPFLIKVKEGFDKAAEELAPYNVTCDWIVPGESHLTEYFGKAIETSVVQGYDAILTLAGEAGIVPYINKSVESGIPVATWNSDTAKESKRVFFVGADTYKQGLTLGEHMVRELDGKGKLAIITGFFAVESHEDRRMGLRDYLAEHAPDIEIVGEVENSDKASIAYG
jgi:ribose transport system substrate-binding protein